MAKHRLATALTIALSALATLPGVALAGSAKIGEPAPLFHVSTLTKDKLDLAALRGKVVVINRWATWCVPCQGEFLLFDKYAQLRGQYGLVVIAIESGGADAGGPMRKLAQQVHFPVAMEQGARAGAYPLIGNALPTNYVIDRAGVVRYAKAGAFDLDVLNAVLTPLLNEPPPPDLAAGGADRADAETK